MNVVNKRALVDNRALDVLSALDNLREASVLLQLPVSGDHLVLMESRISQFRKELEEARASV